MLDVFEASLDGDDHVVTLVDVFFVHFQFGVDLPEDLRLGQGRLLLTLVERVTLGGCVGFDDGVAAEFELALDGVQPARVGVFLVKGRTMDD